MTPGFTTPSESRTCFGPEFTYTEGGTPWLAHVTNDPEEFARILDRADATKVKARALADEYRREWEARQARGLDLPLLGTGSRGPATIMTSVLQPEIVFF
jgi:hypothetical protein